MGGGTRFAPRMMTFDGLGACCKLPSVASLTIHCKLLSHSWQAHSESSKSFAFVKKLSFRSPKNLTS